MKKKIFITGIAGFIGSHLAEYCLHKGALVSGTILEKEDTKNIDNIKDQVSLFKCDLTNKKRTKQVLGEIKPDIIFHLAGQSSIALSFKHPDKTLLVNIFSTLNILESSKELNINPIIQIAGSAAEYGLIKKEELPIKENVPLVPLSPYAVSKVTQEMLALQYYKTNDSKIIITRFFNIEGARKDHSAVSSFAQQIALIEKGNKAEICVGNLDAIRDFVDIDDLIKALWVCVVKCDFGESYNIGTGRGYKIRDVLDMLISLSKNRDIQIKQTEERIRSNDVPVLISDSTKFKKKTDWIPKTGLKTTLKKVLNHYRYETKD